MKMIAYNYRPDELDCFRESAAKYGVDLILNREVPSPENADAARGCTCMSILTTPMTRGLLQKYYDEGVRFLSTRSIGYDHIDVGAAKEIGMHVGNVSYAPDSVADYTVMLILMATRKMKAIARRSAAQDFTLAGLQGVVLHRLTVGIIGTGHIGRLVAKRLSAFGCRIIAHDLFENDQAKQYVEYVSLDRLYAQSDIISLHMPATKENRRMIGKEALAAMKDGVFLVNTARGSLVDTQALADAVESGKVGGAALDVIEGEAGIYYSDRRNSILTNRGLAVLRSYPNVIVTPHTAFYTDQAVGDMVEHSVESCVLFSRGQENTWQVV